jgi:hypothetical protein
MIIILQVPIPMPISDCMRMKFQTSCCMFQQVTIIILYPNIETMRKVYSSYVKKQLEEQPDSVVLFLSYYDTTDIVRGVLSSKGIHVKEREKEGSIIILDKIM